MDGLIMVEIEVAPDAYSVELVEVVDIGVDGTIWVADKNGEEYPVTLDDVVDLPKVMEVS